MERVIKVPHCLEKKQEGHDVQEVDKLGPWRLTKTIIAAISIIARRNCLMARFSPYRAL